MIAKYNNISLAIGIPALLMKMSVLVIPAYVAAAGPKLTQEQINTITSINGGLFSIGYLLLFIAIGFYCTSKQRSILLSLLGIFGIFGFIDLLLLKDRHKNTIPNIKNE